MKRMVRPGRVEMSIGLPEVEGSERDGNWVPWRCWHAPSSSGSGMPDQFGAAWPPVVVVMVIWIGWFSVRTFAELSDELSRRSGNEVFGEVDDEVG